MTTTFITGANKSLGHETARRLIEAGHTVIIGARDSQRGRAAADVAANEGGIDVLINNAGVLGPHIPAADASDVFDINVVGIVRVTHAFLPLLRKSEHPVVVHQHRAAVHGVDPGYTATDFNGHSGHQTVTEGTGAIVALATIGPFIDRDGTVPW